MNTSSYRILTIDENAREAAQVSSALQHSGFSVTVISNSSMILDVIEHYAPDLLLIGHDIVTQNPGILTTISTCAMQRRALIILLLSNNNGDCWTEIQRADDFLVRPFTTDELVSRVKHSLWRRFGSDDGNVIRCGNLTIDVEKCQVFVANRRIDLTFKEYELLKLFATNKGKVFTRESLFDVVWEREYDRGNRTVDVHIRRLRSKIEIDGNSFVETVRNVGYRLKTE